jgi:hypothetical protein
LHTLILLGLLHLRPAKYWFSLTAINDWRPPRLSSAGNQRESSRAREKIHSSSADFSVVIAEWERSHHNDSEEIYREGRPHGKEDPLRGLLHAERELSCVCHVLRSKQEFTPRDSLNSLIFQSCGGFLLAITLGCHEWYNLTSSNEGTIRRFEIAASMLQYCCEENAKNTRTARRDSEKNAPHNARYFHGYRQ